MVEASSQAGSRFVGRERELGELRPAFEDAIAGRARLMFLVGEPGIGKTRLAEEFTVRARDRGALVLWGSCHKDEGAPAYWPWVQMLRSLLHGSDVDAITKEIGAVGARDIAQLVPGLVEQPDASADTDLHPEITRFRVFDSVATLLRNAAQRGPLALVLDDLQWADKPSLLLLEFLSRALSTDRVFILGTYRHTEITRGHPLWQTLGELTRAERVLLGGLTEQNVASFIELVAGWAPSEALVAQVYATTEGNPFFVAETLRLLAAEGRLDRFDAAPGRLAIPVGARELIGRRLDRLSPECNTTLALAAVAGNSFARDILERAGDVTGERLLEVIDEAAAAGIIEEVPGTFGRYVFSHALIRETLYAELSTAALVRLHRAVGEALEQVGAREAGLAELAHHFFEAAKGGDVEKAVLYEKQAGDLAVNALAYEEAVAHYDRALQVLERTGASRDADHADLLLALGAAQGRSGDRERSKETFLRAVEIGRRHSDTDWLARAALGYGGGLEAAEGGGTVDEILIRLLEEALETKQATGALRVRLLGRLAVALYFTDSLDRRDALTKEALEISAGIDDIGTRAVALSSRRYALWSPDNLEERARGTDEILRLALDANDRERVLQVHRWRMMDFFELGDLAAVDREIEAHAVLADQLRQALYRAFTLVFRAMRALMEGKFDAATRFGEDAVACIPGHPTVAVLVLAQQTYAAVFRGEKDRLAERVGWIRSAVNSMAVPNFHRLHTALIQYAAEAGSPEDARAAFDRVSADRFSQVSKDFSWMESMMSLTRACVALHDERHAATLYELIAPMRGRHAISSTPLREYYGPFTLMLGQLASVMGQVDDAAPDFEDAIAHLRAFKARPLLAEALVSYGEMLRANGETQKAKTLLDEGFAIANELGMKMLLERRGGTAETGAAEHDKRATFRQEGEYWAIAFSGDVFRLKDQKGLVYLDALLRAPGKEISAVDLAGAGVEGGDAGELIDARARAEYKERLSELAADLEEADANADVGRASKIREEIDVLTDQLTAATGLGGRSRKAASTTERARVSVRNAITSALKAIKRYDEPLWRHLTRSVKTGTFCVYDPETPVDWGAI